MRRRRALALLGALVGGLTLGWVVPRRRNRYYEGPPSDHFDGTVFFNPGAEPPRGYLDLLRWQLFAADTDWPESYPSPFRNVALAGAEGDGLRVTLIGHATFLVQADGVNLLIDPVWADRASPVSFAGPRRVNPPAIALEALPPIHAVLISHNHYDHLDLATLRRLVAAHAPSLVVPLGNDTIIRDYIPEAKLVAADWGDVVEVAAGVRVHLVQSLHWSARSMVDRRHALWASFVIETSAGKVYAVGDSGLGDGETFRAVARRHPDLRVALLPIGAYEPRWFMRSQHMNPSDAVQALQACGAPVALGHHWGTFKLTNEGVEAPVRDLERALARHGVPASRFVAMRPGQVWTSGAGMTSV